MTSLSELQASDIDWHGLDPSKFGNLKLYGRFSISREADRWTDDTDCLLFEEVLVFTVEKKPVERVLKGSILRKHLKGTKLDNEGETTSTLNVNLTLEDFPVLKLRSSDRAALETWKDELSAMAGANAGAA